VSSVQARHPPPLRTQAFEERAATGGDLLRRHAEAGGDRRLAALRFDPSDAALRLWDFLLTEEDRLREARQRGWKLVGAMKDLGTVPVMAFALPRTAAFYPDGAWWTPCLMEGRDRLFAAAESLGVDASFCPVRAMLGAFVTRDRFPLPDLLVCSVGAVCDDFSAIAQRVAAMGHPILWWEMPFRRAPERGETAVTLPGGARAPAGLVDIVRMELARVRDALADLAGARLDGARLARAIRCANAIRRQVRALRACVFRAPLAPLPALELQIAEMLLPHFCSDRDAAARVIADLLREARRRVRAGQGFGAAGDARLFWVNPVADLRAMALLDACGGRLCGTDFLFTHALDPIPETLPPLEALARSALADPMVGPADQRARRIAREMRRLGAEALVISRIPGASHCAHEGSRIAEIVHRGLDVPVVEIEVPSVLDPVAPALRTRLEALVETVRARRPSAARPRSRRTP